VKRISLLATVVAAALLGALVIGATSASATVLCKQSAFANYCGYENFYPKGTNIEASLAPGTEAKLVDSVGTAYGKCKASSISMTLNVIGGLNDAPGADVSAHSFGECSASMSSTPYSDLWFYWTPETHGGTFWHGFVIETSLPKMWGLTGQCRYNMAQKGETSQFVPGETPQMVYKNLPGALEKSTSHWACDPVASFTATYNVSTPTPLYIEKY